MFLFLDFLFPILFYYNQPLQEWHFTPLSNGEGKASPKGCAGVGLSYSAFTFPAGFSFAAL